MTLLYRLRGTLPGREWNGLELDFVDLGGADLSGMCFVGSSLAYANLDNADLEGTDFTDCDLTGVRLEETMPVTAIAANGGGDGLLAAYGDGVVRAWDIHHARKSTSLVVYKSAAAVAGTMGDVIDNHLGVQFGQDFALFDVDRDGMWNEVARFLLSPKYSRVTARRSRLDVHMRDDDGSGGATAIELHPSESIYTPRHVAHFYAGEFLDETVSLAGGPDGLRLLRTAETEIMLDSAGATCCCTLQLGKARHLVGAGLEDGTVAAWYIDSCGAEVGVTPLMREKLHDGAVTCIAFIADDRVASGAADRRIYVMRLRRDEPTSKPVTEHVLHLTLRCRGMKVDGVKPASAQDKLRQLIASANAGST